MTQNARNSGNKQQFLYGILFVLAFCYVLIRAFTVGVTYDESWTLREIVPGSFYSIVRFDYVEANNHVLNSLLIKSLQSIGLKSLFFARLPNVLAFIGFSLFSMKICRNFTQSKIGLLCFVLLLFNPFAVEFFSLARGYGISLCFMSGSLYYLQLSFKNGHSKYQYLALSCAALSVYAGFSMMNYYIVLFGVLVLLGLYRRRKLPYYLWLTLITGILALICYEPVRKLVTKDRLTFGGTDNIYSDTFVSMARNFLFTHENEPYVYWFTTLFLVILGSLILVSLVKKRVTADFYTAILILFGISLLSTIVQFYVLGTYYLVERTALFLFVLAVLVAALSLDRLPRGAVLRYSTLLLSVVYFSYFLYRANFNKALTWDYEYRTEYILDYLNERAKATHTRYTVNYDWVFNSSVKYYLQTKDYPHLARPEDQIDGPAYFIALDRGLEYVMLFEIPPDLREKRPELAFEKDHIYVYRTK